MPIKVKEIKLTCSACPTQWSGIGENGEKIYIRYRWGYLTLRNGDNVIHGEQLGDDMDGVIDYYNMTEALKDYLDFSSVEEQ